MDDYDFVEQPSRDYFCRVSSVVLLEPYQTQCCGFHLSQEVFRQFQGEMCPICKEGNFTATHDKYHGRKLLSLKVRCPHKAEGCEWEGELGCLLEQHLKSNANSANSAPDSKENVCGYMKIECPYSCSENVQRRDLEEHKSQHCPLRPFACQYCNHEAVYQEVTKEHWPICEKYPLPCPNECGEEELERQHLKGHLEQTCPLEVIQCEFNYVGCEAELQRRLLPEHIKETTHVHTTLLSKELKDMVLSQMGKTAQQLQHIQQLEDQIKQQGDQIKQQADQIKQMVDQIKQQGEVIEEQKELLKQHENAITKEALTPKSKIHFIIPPVNLVMDDFRWYKKQKALWWSPPFYSHASGYKMCLSVDANGRGSGKGTHVSVYVHLMRGEFDDNLEWPFCGAVKLKLKETPHLEMSVVFNERLPQDISGKSSSPINRHGYGIPKFISHSDLHSGEYLHNSKHSLVLCVDSIVPRLEESMSN